MKALVGVDGSEHSKQALALAAGLLDATQDHLVLYYSIPSLDSHQSKSPAEGLFDKARLSLASALFENAKAQVSSEFGSRLTLLPDHMSPAQGLLAAADEEDADFISVGARGLGAFKRLLLGSVSRAVVHESKRPVLIARLEEETAEVVPLNVLFALGPNEVADAWIPFLNQLSWSNADRGRVIRVVESIFVHPLPDWLAEEAKVSDADIYAKAFIEEHERDKQKAKEQSQQFLSQLPTKFQSEEPIVAEGHPAEVIVKLVEKEGVNLIVCGTRGLAALQRVFMGSISEYLLSHAPCSVLVIPDSENED